MTLRSRLLFSLGGLLLALLGAVRTSWAGTGPQGPALTPRSRPHPTGVVVEQPEVVYQFGEYILFSARLVTSQPMEKVTLFYHPESQPYTLVGEMALDTDGKVLFVHEWRQRALPPFVTVYYWFRVTWPDGSTETTPSFTFTLEDNRFTWSRLEAPPFTVYWYAGDEALAQEVINAAQQGVLRMQQQWQAPEPKAVAIYVYDDYQAFQVALNGMPSWAAGHADPRLGKVFVSLPPGDDQGLETHRQVPHELAHVLLAQTLGTGYDNLPRWLDEGIASLAEAFPMPHYQTALEQAAAEGHLLPLNTLCEQFPAQAGQALLAYAEARAFTRYLYERFGGQGLRALLQVYALGTSCEEGPRAALGAPLSELERAWHRTLRGPTVGDRLLQALPLWGLLLALLLPWGLLGLMPRLQPPRPPHEPHEGGGAP